MATIGITDHAQVILPLSHHSEFLDHRVSVFAIEYLHPRMQTNVVRAHSGYMDKDKVSADFGWHLVCVTYSFEIVQMDKLWTPVDHTGYDRN